MFGRQLRFLALQRFQVQAHHGDFDGLRVDIHAEQVVAQNFGLAIHGEALRAIGVGVHFAHEVK